MTGHNAAPPPIAVWLVTLVAASEQTATILGDLLEEFSSMVSRSGTAQARRWYWRQSVRTIGHLLRGQLRQAPTETATFAIGGFLVYVIVERVLEVSAQAVVAHSHVYYLLSAVPFWQAIDAVGRYVVPVVVGWTIARAARGREMMAALSVGILLFAWILAIYTSVLLATAGFVPIKMVPDFSFGVGVLSPPPGPPHGPSVMNTLRHVRFTFVHWWIPTIALLSVGAAIRRTTSPGRLGREAAT